MYLNLFLKVRSSSWQVQNQNKNVSNKGVLSIGLLALTKRLIVIIGSVFLFSIAKR